MTTPLLKLTPPTATIELNNPESANRLTVEDLAVLMRYINQVNNHADITILVLQSTGKYFCSGFDISSLDQDAKEKSLLFEDVVNAVEDCRPITIASLQGGVYGGATDLALACDFRIGCEATEMFMPAAKLGIHFYQRGLERYVSRLGIDVAKRLLLKAEKIDSREMKSIGFLTELVENHDLNNATQNLINLIQPMAPLSLLGMKKHLNKIARNQLDLTQLNSDIAKAQNSEDLKEGRNAWLEKRPAQFKGF
jgi:enoyl-CoA hydratase/carnithine racemase